METCEEDWVSCEPVIILDRIKIPSPCNTPEANRSGNLSSPDSGDNGKCSSARKKLREEEKQKREEERKKRLEAAEEAKRKKEEEKKRKEEERKKREEERKKKEEEKEEERKRREEERKKREEEKKKKEEEKEEERKRREEERKKREEEKEEERKKREEEKRKKEEERKKKEEEKEEEKRKREEDRKKKEEERLKAIEEKRKQAEAEERKKARVSQSFVSFFKRVSTGSENVPKKPTEQEPWTGNSIFKPFQLQPFQSLADYVPSFSKERFDRDGFDSSVASQSVTIEEMYVNQFKSGQIQPYRCYGKRDSRFKKEEESSSSAVIIVEPTVKNTYKAKYFDISDIRPPYYGTWRKRSKTVNGRRPWVKDTQYLDYDVDSEEEWDGEEEEGESIVSSGSDSSRNGNDDFEMDDFLVPHGHLSGDEEACEEDEEDEEAPKKHVTLIKEEDLLKARSKKVSKLNPFVIGPYWMTKDNMNQDAFKLLEPYKCVFNV